MDNMLMGLGLAPDYSDQPWLGSGTSSGTSTATKTSTLQKVTDIFNQVSKPAAQIYTTVKSVTSGSGSSAAPAYTPPPSGNANPGMTTGLSTGTKIALGVSAVVVIGGVVYLVTRKKKKS
jgi:hypothetical protein